MGSADIPSTHLTLLNELAQDSPSREEAWRIFWQRYYPLILHWCQRWLSRTSDAEEVASQVLEKLVSSIPTFDANKGSFRVWLKAVVNNAVRKEFRYRSRHPGDYGLGGSDAREQLESLLVELGSSLDNHIRDDVDRTVSTVKRCVSTNDWEAFQRTVCDGQDVAEVARQLGKSRPAVFQAIYRVRKLLRETYNDFQKDLDGPHEPQEKMP